MTPPTTAVTEHWSRLSPRVIWVDLVLTVLSLLPAGLAAILSGAGFATGAVWPLTAVAAFGMIGALTDAVRWIFTRYRVTDTHIELRTGVIFKQHRSLRRERIRSVDIEAKLRHRLSHLRMVKVGAGQHAATGESAFTLDALSVDDAHELQSALVSRSARRPDQDESEDTRQGVERAVDEPEPLQTFAHFTPRWVIYNMFNIWAYVLSIGLLGGLWGILSSFGVDVTGIVVDLHQRASLGWIATIAVVVVGVSIIGFIGLTLNYFTEYWRFELTRVPGPEGTQLRTRQGLFTTREVNRAENRIRGVQISEPLAWRWLGVTDTRVITTGLDEWSLNDPAAILPRTHRDIATRTAASVLGEKQELFDAPLIRHPIAALRRRLWWATLTALLFSAVIAVAVAAELMPTTAFWGLAVYWPLSLAAALVAYRALGHAIVGPYLIIRSGLITRSTAILRRDAVSTIAVRESLLQRRLRLRTVSAMTAAGYGKYSIPDIEEHDALRLADSSAPGILDPFLVRDTPSDSSQVAPAPPAQRLLAPDLARGFMLLLIAMAYASVYVGAEFGVHVTDQPWWDRAAVVASTLFLDNRAFPMFAILFGYGVAWSARRQRERGVEEREIKRVLRRRAWILLAIGAVHAALVFPGEILTSYGLAILVSGWLLFRSITALRVTALITGAFYLVTVSASMILLAYGRIENAVTAVPGYSTLEDWITRIGGVPITPVYLALVYPLLLLVVLGYLAAHEKLIEEPERHRALLMRTATLGIAFSVLGAVPSALIFVGVLQPGWFPEGLAMGLQVLTGIAGGAGYVALFVLLSDRIASAWRAGADAVAAVGRRSLTFYLLNSIVVALVLHTDLIGLDVGALGALTVAAATWLVSVGVAVALKRSGHDGPMEQLKRRAIQRSR